MPIQKEMLKPERLHDGDTIAVLSPSSGAAQRFPTIYQNGLTNLQKVFGLKIKEYPTTKATNDYLYSHPKERADEINSAFADKEVKGIIAAIGGDDSVRILPYLDIPTIMANPKVFMGVSDTTSILSYLNYKGLITFHGPTIMMGISQMNALPAQFAENIREMLFESKDIYRYTPYNLYCDGYPEWSVKENLGKVNELKETDGWHWLQGETDIKGTLFGGNIEVLEMLKGSNFWPTAGFWKKKIAFLETSEEKPTPQSVKYFLRNYGVQGILEKINALLFAIPMNYSDEEKKVLEEVIIDVVNKEFGRTDLPIITNMEFGHTDPRFIIPYGVEAEIDCKKRTFELLEPAVK